MKGTTRLSSRRIPVAVGAVLAYWLLALPPQLTATNTCSGAPGNNGVYNLNCNNGSPGVVGSPAFTDASMFASSPPPPSRNFCGVLNWVLNPSNHILPPTGGVIDARGLPGTTGTSMTCTAANPSPWAGIANSPPSVILLPAGTIIIPGAWVLPNNTRLIGEGDALNHNFPSGTIAVGTTLQACKSSCTFTGTDMIDLGSSNICDPQNNGTVCNNVSVENLILDGQGQSLNGIVNANAQTGTYVDRPGGLAWLPVPFPRFTGRGKTHLRYLGLKTLLQLYGGYRSAEKSLRKKSSRT
jgi:hypothetical protein